MSDDDKIEEQTQEPLKDEPKKNLKKEPRKSAPKITVELPANTEIGEDEDEEAEEREAKEKEQRPKESGTPKAQAPVAATKPAGETCKCPICGKVVKVKGLGKHKELAHGNNAQAPAARGEESSSDEVEEKSLEVSLKERVEQAKENPLIAVAIVGGVLLLAIIAFIVFSKKEDEEGGVDGQYVNPPTFDAPASRVEEMQAAHESEPPVVEIDGRFYKLVPNRDGGYDKILVE